MEIKFCVSNICTAFQSQTVGSKVLNTQVFLEDLRSALQSYNPSKDREPGQHFVLMPDSFHTVSAGDGLKSDNTEDYIVRTHREGPKMFLKRHCAGSVKFLACVVYTREAYLKDPDYDGSEDLGDATHIIVAVIASSGPNAPVTPFRFVHNLAGGNLEYKQPPRKDFAPQIPSYWHNYLSPHWMDYAKALEDWGEFITKKAKEVVEHWNSYSVVAD
jgi:hypothetical protein